MIEGLIYNSLIGALAGIWAFLFTGPLSQAGMAFGWLKVEIYRTCPEWLYLPLIGCAKCNAFWWAVLVCLIDRHFSAEILIIAVFTAYKLEQQNG